MIEDTDIEKLASLCRIEIAPHEQALLRKDIEAILAYVSDIEKVSAEAPSVAPYSALKNVLREDGEAYPAGLWSDALMAQVPNRDGAYVKVKNIFSQK